MAHAHVMDWPRGVAYDAIRGCLLGDKIGEGNGRDREVYVCGFDDSLWEREAAAQSGKRRRR